MEKYEQIKEAMGMFGLSEHETMRDIKIKINNLIIKWHPDKCNDTVEKCFEKSVSLINAKKIILKYCENYKISFKKDEVEKYLDPEEFWERQFGKDPLWGNPIK